MSKSNFNNEINEDRESRENPAEKPRSSAIKEKDIMHNLRIVPAAAISLIICLTAAGRLDDWRQETGAVV